MEDQHRKKLRQRRSKIIQNVAKPLDVLESLYEYEIFTEGMKQDVEAKSTQIEQMRKILDILPSRGPRAFETFLKCLRATDNSSAVDLLCGEVQVKEQYDGVLPKDWPNEELVSREIQVRDCYVHSEIVRKYWNNPNGVYSMKKRQRGRCVIISNLIFTGPLERDAEGTLSVSLTTRTGTEKDASDMKELFSQLHFTVVVHKDKGAKEIRDILLQESAHPDQAQAECFVCVICSHGTSTGVYGSDGDVVSLDEITAQFDRDNCPNLVDKPKLFFIQACKGETIDRQSASTTIEDVGQDLSGLDLNQSNASDTGLGNPISSAPQNTGVRLPVQSDILVACATLQGYVSVRHKTYGSWFIQAVVYVFQQFSHEESILHLLSMVNNLVACGVTPASKDDPGGAMQMSNVYQTLRKKLYFFPGRVEKAEF